MKKRKLPEPGSRDERIIKNQYATASKEKIREWTKKFGFSSVSNFQNAVRQTLGLRRLKKPASDLDDKELVVNLPKINILTPNINFGAENGDEEIIGVIVTDGHAGKITRTFNKSVYRSRMETMFESIMILTELHRHMYPIKKIVIFATGDNIQGENPYQGSKIGDVEMGARDQVKFIATPRWNDVLGSLSTEFEEVEVHCIPGNHGKEKLAPETSSYDLLMYDVLQEGIGNRIKNININIYDSFAHVVDVSGFRFLLFHGDGIPCQYGVPFFALDKKLVKWHMQLGGFNYAVGGHFHKRHSDEVSSKLEYFMSGSLVTDDDWALKKLGISSNPSQFIFGIHPKNGVTWRYPLIVDKGFVPEKY